MTHNQTQVIAQFVKMTQTTESQAQFFLEMNYWDLRTALACYSKTNNDNTLTESSLESTTDFATSVQSSVDLASDSKDEQQENLYADGEKSDMCNQDPSKEGGHELVEDILKKAAEEKANRSAETNYTGAGYRLGSKDVPSTQPELETVTRRLIFWRDGFSIDDGPLYEYSNPANQKLLTDINNGRAPLYLLNVRPKQPVDVHIIKRQEKDYAPPKVTPKPFEGSGHRLGAPLESRTVSVSNSQIPVPTVDPTQPMTTIQIRLEDGSRLIVNLNHTHTIGDIRQYIESRSNTNRQYSLQTTFPVKQLENSNQTIKEAGLLNSVIVQRYQ